MNKEGGSLGGMPSLDEFPNVYCPTCRRIPTGSFRTSKG